MKIAVPIYQGQFSEHFGGAEQFGFFAVDDDRRVGDSTKVPPPEHGRGVFPMWLRDQGITHVLAGGMGPRAIDILGRHGIEVVLGVKGSDPEAVVQSYLEGTLMATGEVCHDHSFHDCGHSHGGDRHHHGRGGCHQG